MIDPSRFEDLHIVRKVKEKIRKWWRIELSFADATGFVVDHRKGVVIPPHSRFCEASLGCKEGFGLCNRSIEKAVRDLATGTDTKAVVVDSCHMGFHIIACPVRSDDKFHGAIFACGFLQDDAKASRGDLIQSNAAKEGLTVLQPDAAYGDVPSLSARDMDYFKDLLETTVAEIVEFSRTVEQKEARIAQLSRELGVPPYVVPGPIAIVSAYLSDYEVLNPALLSTLTVTFAALAAATTLGVALAVAMAASALLAKKVSRIVLVRPAVEAGERLGFLPGDMAQKVDPYLRPMYDALYELMGFERVARFIERNAIEVAPLAFMRGRSLNESFIILDEAQNTTIEQMKMFLTRIGFGARAVVTGDLTQTDLPSGRMSGLQHAQLILRGVQGVAFTMFDAGDVVRHPLVQRIVQAYESHETARDP